MLCGQTEDNGWGGTWGLNWLLRVKGYKFVEFGADPPDFCDDCLGKTLKNASELPKDAFVEE